MPSRPSGGGERHGQHPFDWPRLAGQGELADHCKPAFPLQGQLPAADQKPRAIGRSKPPASFLRLAGARLITIRSKTRCYLELTRVRSTRRVLSLHRSLGQSDQHQLGHRRGRDVDVDVDLDGKGVDADQGLGRQLCEHGGSTPRQNTFVAHSRPL